MLTNKQDEAILPLFESRLIDADLQSFFSPLQTKGMQSLPRLVLFTSADAHYSVKKLASFMGIGTDNVYLINTDDVGKIDVAHLGEQVLTMSEAYNCICCH